MKSFIQFSENVHDTLPELLNKRKYSSIALLLDENTKTHCYSLIESVLPQHFVIQVRSGEENKNLETCVFIWDALTNHLADRDSVLVVLGGGMLCDIGGFCAASYKRGIHCIYIPTTLLAQVDASIGGKVGVNHFNLKNNIGLFSSPQYVLISSPFLRTLSLKELKSGFAEVIKNALIADPQLWQQISGKTFLEVMWEPLIQTSVAIKRLITEDDPFENGRRKSLNFGHTIGHAVESFFMYTDKQLLHGEAVAIGLIMESFLSVQHAQLSQVALQEITLTILQSFSKVELPPVEMIFDLMIHDKKAREGKCLCVLLNRIGEAIWDVPITLNDLRDVFNYYNSISPSIDTNI